MRPEKSHVFCLAVSILIGSASASGQGMVNFRNTGVFATPADRLVRDSAGNLLVGTNYLAQLYYGAPWSFEAQLISVASSPARFRVPGTSLPGTWVESVRTLQGFTTGQEVSLQVRVWDVAVGETWEQAVTAGFDNTQYGVSAVFSYRVPVIGDTSPFAFQMDNLRAFSLVPEPAVVVLGLAGGIGLWLLRRRVRERIDI